MARKTEVIKFVVEPEARAEAEQLAAAYGMSLSALLRYLLRTTKPPKRRAA